MAFPTTIEDYTIVVTNDAVSAVRCNHCDATVEYKQPDTSTDPGDVEIYPSHSCSNMPEEPTEVTLAEPVMEDAKGNVIAPADYTDVVEANSVIEAETPVSAKE